MTRRRFALFAWSVLALNVGVIAWGAVVRATGSGAGCGSHWPRCDGAVLPGLEDSATAIEFGHRLSSGVALLAVAGLAWGARRLFAPGHRVRFASGWALVFIVVEALIGAALVTYGWVDDDTSTARVVAIAVHLANTFVLLGWLTMTAWWASGRPAVSFADRRRVAAIGVALGGLVLVGAVGAVTALGDTLFPAATVADDFDPSSHYLVRLRAVHPVLAVLAAGYLVTLARRWMDGADGAVRGAAVAVVWLVAVQLVAGVVNLALAAPLWLQVVHLLLADALWVATVLLGASGLAVREPTAAGIEVAA